MRRRPQVYCRKCGKQLPDDGKFCDACGTPMNVGPSLAAAADTSATRSATSDSEAEIAMAGAEVARAGAEVARAKVEMTKATTAAPTTDIFPKSRLAAALLAFFLGIFGAHRFYLGKTGSAVGMLALTILGIVIAVVTGDIYGFAFLPFLAIGRAARFGVAFIPILAVGIWSLIDFIVILCGRMKDSSGRRVKKWR
jgi:TM2 domain-containing membrane protein YozV